MNKQDTIGDRLKDWINSKDLSASDFAKQIQIQRSALSHIFSGRNKPSVDVLLKIKNAYPDIDLDWLITGELSAHIETEKLKLKENTSKFDKSLVTDVNILTKDIGDQNINKNKIIGSEDQSNDRSLVRIIELYSDGTFKHYEQ